MTRWSPSPELPDEKKTKGFELLEHTADVRIRAWGRDLAEACEALGEGLLAVLDPSPMPPATGTSRITVTAPDERGLIVRWLNELIYRCAAEGKLYSGFRNTRVSLGRGESAQMSVEASEHDAGEIWVGCEVKGATYHGLSIVRREGRCEITVILDI